MFENMSPSKKRRIRLWAIICAAALVIALVVTLVATNRNFSHVIDNVMGGKRAILVENDELLFQPDEGIETKADAAAHGNAVNIEVCAEGTVLLKNDGALPLERGAKVSVFGKNSVDLVISGSGSATSAAAMETKSIYDSLEAAGFIYNPALKEFYENDNLSGPGRTANPKIENSGNVTLSAGETPVSSYTGVRDSYAEYGDAAIIVLSRIGGEGFDLPRTQQEDASRHYLELSANEEALIGHVTSAGFGEVILVINAANPLELREAQANAGVGAVLWVGNPGAQGIMALGGILNGDTNPSGRLPDTYPADFREDPVWQNFGDNGNENGDRFIYKDREISNYFVDYEEGIYVGYRYWETRYAETSADERDAWYAENVVYPFGYGLSYTDFAWSVPQKSVTTDEDGKIEIEVTVTNAGDTAGKEVVQIYAVPPYTAGGIEKSAKVLVAFAKTEMLYPADESDGEDKPNSQTLTLSVDPYAMASYDYTDANKNGFSGYELEAGEYTLCVARNAHETEAEVSFSQGESMRWETDAYTAEGTKIENRFGDISAHIDTFLSRADFAGTFPASPTKEERVLSQEMYTALRDTKSTDNPILSQRDEIEMPVTGKDRGVRFRDLYGKDFDDPLWQDLLDAITADEMLEMQMFANFNTADMPSINKPKITDADGPNGFTNFMGDPTVYGTVKYCCEGIMAATFSTDLMYELGNAVGNESLIGNEQGDGVPYTGWYAPALNLHRGQFGGRNCEYFSEDPLLSGIMGAYEILGAREKGVVTYVKHFVGNEQETHRAAGGNCTFTNEQALRELYLKPFEYAVKLGGTKGIMSSFNRLGTTWTGGDYRLLTEVLRQEWGFHGAVITDFNTNPSYMNTRQMAYAGGTLDLASQPHDWADTSDPLDMYILRWNTHETLYAVVDSNALNNTVLGYRMAYWRIALYSVDGAVAAAVVVSGLAVFLIKDRAESAKGRQEVE